MTPSTVSIVFQHAELSIQIGEHPWEKFADRPTRLIVNLTLSFDYSDYFDREGGYIDYDPLRAFLKELESQPHVNKIETFSKTILGACFAMTPAHRVKLAVCKPDIFNEMQGVGIEIDVKREDFLA